MSKFTPGPWDLDGDLLITKADPFEERCFGRLSVGVAFGGDNTHATEALILAAPDLLEALEAILHDCDPNSRIGRIARAAIAKARGEA